MPAFESRQPRRTSGVWWEVLKLDLGKPWKGWMAGPAVGVECHFVEGSRKACRASFTDGKVSCAYCAEGIGPRFTGYVPLWSAEGRRWMLIMGERHWPAVQSLALHTPVSATKTRSRGQAIHCGRSRWTDQPPPLVGNDQVEQDVTPNLLTMWGDDVLKEWCVANVVAKTAAVPPAPAKPPRKRPASKPPADDGELAARVPSDLAAKVMERLSTAEMFPALAARIAGSKPSTNGTGAHPPKPR